MNDSKPPVLSTPCSAHSRDKNAVSASAAGRRPLPPLPHSNGEPTPIPCAFARSSLPRLPIGLATRAFGTQERRIVRHAPRQIDSTPRAEGAEEEKEEKGERAETKERVAVKPAFAERVPDPERFAMSIEMLNNLVNLDGKDTDRRAWVTRYAEDKASARLCKEELLPVWFLVTPDALLIIDMNGTAQHSNYVGAFDSCDAMWNDTEEDKDEKGHWRRVVASMLESIRHGEVQLPQCSAEAAAMNIPPAAELRWGEPVGVLIRSPRARISILRDICQMYMPSFLQRAYPNGVPLRGHWPTTTTTTTATTITAAAAAASMGSEEPFVLRIPRCVRTSLLSALQECGHHSPADRFAGVGARAGDPSGPPLALPERPATAPQGSSPWQSAGRQPLFTAWLSPSGGRRGRKGRDAAAACLGVLVLTPRGPLEFQVDCPGIEITVEDVRASLLRSGLGRSMRLMHSAVQFRYAPGQPLLDSNDVIGTKYAVLRLQTRR